MTQEHTVLGGRYQLDQVIGRGGMAEVWRARDLRLGRDVAVKRLRVDLATDPTFQARFRREAQSAAGLNHPNIVATYDTGEEIDDKTGIAVPWIVMELVEGHTLRDILRTDRRILPAKALEWTQGVLDALNYSHRAGIIHRDIKPANVMLTPNGQVKVMDFGIARAVADTSATMTQTAAVIGTAQYLSPEQARGETVDSRSDIYSAGCLLYELLVGRPPFTGDSPVSVAYQHVREQPVPPSTLDPELTSSMDAVVLKSLAKDPAVRYQSAKQMRDDISRVLAGEQLAAPVVVLPPSPGETTAQTEVVGSAASATGVQSAVSAASATAVPTATSAASATAVPEAYETPRRKSRMGWLVGALVLALLAGLGFLGWNVFGPNKNTQLVSVPGVVGFTEAGATSNLQGYGFTVKSKHVNGSADTENQVTGQDPPAGQPVAKGSTVTLTVNDGPVTNKVPSGLIGMTEKQARAALVKAGFKAANISTRTATSDEENDHLDFVKGQVVTANPAPGADVVPATQKVVLALASGQSTVPNLIGLTEADAISRAKDAGFQAETSDRVRYTTDSNSDGKVYAQSVDSGNQATRKDTTIYLTMYVYQAASQPRQTTSSPSPSVTSTATSTSTSTATSTTQPTTSAPTTAASSASASTSTTPSAKNT